MAEGDSIFAKIIQHQADADIVFQDDDIIAITDIRPKARIHILVIPKLPIPSLNDFTVEHTELLGNMLLRCAAIAKEKGIAESGYKVIANTGDDGGQIINHFHLHVVGGEEVNTVV